MLKRNENSSWLPWTISFWDVVSLEWCSTPKYFSSIELKNSILVFLDLCVIPSKNWACWKIFDVSFSSLRFHLFQNISLLPVSVHEQDWLSRALLSNCCICILIASVSYKINIWLLLWHIWSKDFPIETSIFKTNFSVQSFDKVFTNCVGSSK